MSRAQHAIDRSALPNECIYVYGMVDAAVQPFALTGAARGAELDVTRVGAVAAVHSWIEPAALQDVEPEIAEGSRLAELVRRHDEVLTALALAGPVLPVRLGTLLPDVDSLGRMLKDAEDAIAGGLERVRGRAEWNLRMTTADLSDDPAEALPAGAARTQRAGATYLLGRRETRHRSAQRRSDVHAGIAALHECLSQLADETEGAGRAGGPTLARAYLVRHELQEEFLAAVGHGIDELEGLGCEAVLRGPLPPYSFADIRLEAYRHD
jgi:hypothetical protein